MSARLLKMLNTMNARLESLERNSNNMVREGRIVEADPSKNAYVIDASGIKTNPIPQSSLAGDVVDHVSASVGQRVMVISPGGDIGKAFFIPAGYTDDVPQPNGSEKTAYRKIGDLVINSSENGFSVMLGSVGFELTASGVTFIGGQVKHDEKDIGKTHKHLGVVPGGGITDVPV
jgi:hypothetical protein